MLIQTIGLADFNDPTLPPIPFADLDARDVAKALTAFIDRQTILVNRAHPRVIVGAEATTARLTGVFDDLDAALRKGEIGEGDMVIVMMFWSPP